MKEISHLNLSSSQITSIGAQAINLIIDEKTYLNIRNNSLKYLPKKIENTRNTTELWIAYNSYECNCDMMWMRDWLVQATNVMDKENTTCASGDMIGIISYSYININI